MNTYYIFLNVLLILAGLVMLRHSFSRVRYFHQMIQQNGYKTGEFFRWLMNHFYSRILLPEHFLFLLVLFSLLFFLSGRITITSVTLILSVFALFWFGSIQRFRRDRQKKPLVYTPRMIRLAFTHAVLVLFFTFIIIEMAYTGRLLNTPIHIRQSAATLMLFDPYFLFFGLMLVDITIPMFLIFAAWINLPMEWLFHRRFKNRARRKLKEMPDLKIIAITGSYGKTSTKFITGALLKERYEVCVPPGSFNTPMGICKVINDHLNNRHQILLLEMGARYEGNIRELCQIARPHVAVITNMGKAHLETFGSQEAIIREKSTLAKELYPDGLLVLNADDENVARLAELREDVEVELAGVEHGGLRAGEIHYDQEGTRFSLNRMNNGRVQERQEIHMKLLGRHNVQNFLLAAAVAGRFNIRLATMASAAGKISPVEHRLELKKQNGLTVIDDAFNSNPIGARHALEILTSFPSGRKIIVTPGMIELGKLQEKENRSFGELIGKSSLDLVILVGQKQTAPILDGIRQSAGDTTDVRTVNSLFEANEIVRSYAEDGDVVLYENDLPDTFEG